MLGLAIILIFAVILGVSGLQKNAGDRAYAKEFYDKGMRYYRAEQYHLAAVEFRYAADICDYKDSAAMRDLSQLKYYCSQDLLYYSKGTELANEIIWNKDYPEKVRREASELKVGLEAAHDAFEEQKAGEAAIAAAETPELEPTEEPEDQEQYIAWQTITIPSNPSSTNKPASTPKPTATPKTSDDPYHASDFAHPEDFYEWYHDDFYDYEEAEEYWEEHN